MIEIEIDLKQIQFQEFQDYQQQIKNRYVYDGYIFTISFTHPLLSECGQI